MPPLVTLVGSYSSDALLEECMPSLVTLVGSSSSNALLEECMPSLLTSLSTTVSTLPYINSLHVQCNVVEQRSVLKRSN